MKYSNQVELRKPKKLPDGRIQAVHVWATGYQVLVFDNQEHFDKAKSSLSTDGGAK